MNQNLTQAEVAEFIGVSRRQVLNVEKGKTQLEVFVANLAVWRYKSKRLIIK